MPLRIFEARPDRIQVGNSTTAEFDTDVPHMYRAVSSTIKYPRDPTIQISGDRLTYRFDGLTYNINSAISFSVGVETLSGG